MSRAVQTPWRHTLLRMSIIQAILGLTFSIVPPVLPLMLPGMGVDGAQLRLWAGIILGAAPLAAGLTSPLWGHLADRFDRRLIILLACCAVAVCNALMSGARHPAELLLLRLGMGLFGGHAAAALSIVSSAAPRERMGYALGFLATAQLGGALLGPLLGGLIADLFRSFRAPFFAAGVATLLVAALLRHVPAPQRLLAPQPARSESSSPATTSPTPWDWILVLLIAQWAILLPQPIISLTVRALVGTVPQLATLAGFAFSVVALSGLIGSPFLGTLGDRIGRRRLLLGCVLGAAASSLPQAFAHHYALFVAERFLGGFFLSGIIPTANALIAEHAAPHEHGRLYGKSSAATFLGGFLGPLSGGALAADLGLHAAFIGSSALMLLIALLFAVSPRLRR